MNNKLANLKQKYADQIALRAAVQAIPYIGGSIDTLLVGGSARIQLQRVEKFVIEISERLEELERISAITQDEEFNDLILFTFEKVAKTRSTDKLKRFAEIIANQLVKPTSWDEPESAVRLLSDLEDIHIQILDVALKTPKMSVGAFHGLQVISLIDKSKYDQMENPPEHLFNTLPQYKPSVLRMACAELVAKGLLLDEGIGRWDLSPMSFFVATDLAEWLAKWISKGYRDSVI